MTLKFSGNINVVLNNLCCHLLGLTNSNGHEKVKKIFSFLIEQNFKLRKLYSLKCFFNANSVINNGHYLISAAKHLTVALL